MANSSKTSYAGVLAGVFGCVFGILGIFTIGIVFVPLAALCTLAALVYGVLGKSVAGIGTFFLSAALTTAGFIFSPSLWIIAGGFLAAHGINHHDQPIESNSKTYTDVPVAQMVDRPTRSIAFSDFYKVSYSTTQQEIGNGHVSSVWFDQQIENNGKEIYVVFFKKNELDERGEPLSCHACKVTIDVITYLHTEQGWSIESRQSDAFKTGAWGDAPNINKSYAPLVVSPRDLILIGKETYLSQSEENNWYRLFNYRNSQWFDTGRILYSGNNTAGACALSKPLDGGEQGKNCYSFTGKLNSFPVKGQEYPDLEVEKTGTEFDETLGKVVPARSVLYSFNGTSYIKSSKQPLSEDVDISLPDADQMNTSSVPQAIRTGPSFNCGKARTIVEKMICDSTEVSALDRQMSAIYRSTIEAASPDNSASFKQESANWRTQVRDTCKSIDCLKVAYTSRISEMTTR